MVKNKGYGLNPEHLKNLLDRDFWKFFKILEEVDSTNDTLKKYASEGAGEGTVVCAVCQRSGRGRYGRQWYSPPGGAWFSFLLKPEITTQKAGCLAILTAIAIAESLNGAYNLKIKTKWPNDLILDEKKLGGILIETATSQGNLEYVITGVGINVTNPLPEETIISPTRLNDRMNDTPRLEEVIAYSLNGIYNNYQTFIKMGFEPTIKKWENLSFTRGKIIQVKRYNKRKPFRAKAIGLSPQGELIVELDSSISKKKRFPFRAKKAEKSTRRMKLSFEEVSLNVR